MTARCLIPMTDEDVWEKLKTGLFDMIGSCPSKKLVSSLANGTGLDEDGEAVYGVFASLLVATSRQLR